MKVKSKQFILIFLLLATIMGLATFASTVIISDSGNNDIDNQSSVSDQENSNLLSTNDGNLLEEDETLRVVDLQFASSETSVNESLYGEVILGNYGSETKEVSLEPELTNAEDDIVDFVNGGSHDLELDSGEHKKYGFELKFNETTEFYTADNYNIRFGEESVGSEQEVKVLPEGSLVYGSEVVNRDVDEEEISDFSQFRDNFVDADESGAATETIPPSDNQAGNVFDFFNVTGDNTSNNATIEDMGEGINVGFNSQNISTNDYYSLKFNYNLVNMDSIELNVVQGNGEEIDPNTTYKLNNESNEIDQRSFHLSSLESEYIQNNNEVFIVYSDAENSTEGSQVELYSKNINSEDDLNVDFDPELQVKNDDITISGGSEVGERIVLTAEVENIGSAVFNDDIELYETNISSDQNLIDKTDITINPNESEVINFRTEIPYPGENEYQILDSSETIQVDGEEGEIPEPELELSDSTVGIGEEIEADASGTTYEAGEIDQYDWEFNGEEITDGDEIETVEFDEEGQKTITVEVIDEDEGISQSASEIVQVQDGPDIDADIYNYEFVPDGFFTDSDVIGSGTNFSLSSTSCEEECNSELTYENRELFTGEGINLLILDEELNKERYVSYEVRDDDREYNYVDIGDVRDYSYTELESEYNNNTTSDPISRLKDTIDNYSIDGYYMVFVSGGNPQPDTNLDDFELYSRLNSEGAQLNNSDVNQGLGENSSWIFTTQIGVSPLLEEYGEENTVTNDFDFYPVNTTSSSPNIDQPIFYDGSDTTIHGGELENSTFEWDFDDSTTSDELETEHSYSIIDKYNVEFEVIDEEDFTATEDFDIETKIREPVVNFEYGTPVVDEELTINASNSFSRDSMITEFEWDINNNGEFTESGEEVTFELTESGEKTINLKLEDAYEEEYEFSETFNVASDPPSIEYDKQRVLTDFDNENVEGLRSELFPEYSQYIDYDGTVKWESTSVDEEFYYNVEFPQLTDEVTIDYEFDATEFEESAFALFTDENSTEYQDIVSSDYETIICTNDLEEIDCLDEIDYRNQIYNDSITLDDDLYDSFGIRTVQTYEEIPTREEAELNKLQIKSPNFGSSVPTIKFDASESSSPDENKTIEKYEWDIDAVEGVFNPDYSGGSSYETITHEYTEKDEYLVKLRVTDDEGESTQESFTVDVTNLEPEADTQLISDSVIRDEDIDFDAGPSESNGGEIEKYKWFMDGEDEGIEGESVTHSFEDTGEKDYMLVVRDEYGQIDTHTDTISVEDEGPIAEVEDDEKTINLNNDVTLDASESSSPTDDNLSYEWELPNGETEDSPIIEYDPETPTDGSPKKATVTVKDEFDNEDTENVEITVNNRGPILDKNVSTNHEDEFTTDLEDDVILDASDSSHIEGNDIDITTEWTIETEDNEFTTTDETHIQQWDEPGEYTIKLLVEDEFGEIQHTEFEITAITNGPNLEKDIITESDEDDHTYIRDETILEASESTHKDGDFDLNFEWDLGDGETKEGEEITYNWDETGTYDVELTVEDEFGEKESETTELIVDIRDFNIEIDSDNVLNTEEEIEFNTNYRDDFDENNIDFEWTIDDEEKSSNNDSIYYTFEDSDVYNIEIDAETTDEFEQTSSDEIEIEARNSIDNEDVIIHSCGLKSGKLGPEQTDCDQSYEDTTLENNITVDEHGVQKWKVQQTGTYDLIAAGAENKTSKSYGHGAIVGGEIELNRGDKIDVITGLKGERHNNIDSNPAGSGSGATIISKSDEEEPILVAGGSGGLTGDFDGADSANADPYSTSGKNGDYEPDGDSSTGGEDGDGGFALEFSAASGAGYYEFGRTSSTGFNTNFVRANHYHTDYTSRGSYYVDINDEITEAGFGGGGAAGDTNEAGGGGGYSGGGTARGSEAAGGGGGSYITEDISNEIRQLTENDNPPSEIEHKGTGYLEGIIIDQPEIDITDVEDGETFETGEQINLNVDIDNEYSSSEQVNWFLGDKTYRENEDSITHIYDEEGTYSIHVELLDGEGEILTTDEIEIQINV